MEKEIKRLLRCFKRTELSEQDVTDAILKLIESRKAVLPQADFSGQSELLCPFCGSTERTELNTYYKWLCLNCDNAYGYNSH